MIVKCERCQTRFKIPDEKVTDKGVKVRCTKCQHTFRVAREDASSATPAPAPPALEVAAVPKPAAPLRAGTPPAPVAKPAGRPAGSGPATPAAPGVAFPRGGAPVAVPTAVPRASAGAPTTPATIELDPLLEFIGDNTPTPAQALHLAATAPPPNKPAGALAMGSSPGVAQAPSRTPASPKPAVAPKLAVAPKPAQGPSPVPVPARSASPAPAPKPAPSPVPVPARSPAPVPRSSAPAPLDESDPFSLPLDDGATLPATPTLPRRNAPVALDESDPFSLPPSGSEPFDALEGNNPFVSFDAAPTVPATPTLPPAPKPARSAAPAPAPIPAPDSGEMEGLEGNNPFIAFDPVGKLPQAPAPAPSPAPSGIPDWGAPQAGAPMERNPFPLPDFPGPGGASPSREVFPDLPAPKQTPAPPVATAEPAKKKESSGQPPGPPLARRLATLAAQVVVGAVLVIGLVAVGSAWLNEGSLSPEMMREMVSPTRLLVAKELSNGLYETRDGHSLFYVRGEAENRGTAPIRVKARVALYDGDMRVKSAEGLVGAVPTPEELYSLQKPDEADALRARLDAAAKVVAPGARAPFVILFYEYPAGLKGFRLEVTLESQGAGTAAGGPKEGSAGNAQP